MRKSSSKDKLISSPNMQHQEIVDKRSEVSNMRKTTNFDEEDERWATSTKKRKTIGFTGSTLKTLSKYHSENSEDQPLRIDGNTPLKSIKS